MNFINKKYSLYFIVILVFVGLLSAKSRNFKSNKVDYPENWAKITLSKLSLREKIAQFFMVAAYSGGDVNELEKVKNQIKNDKIGGVIFFQGEREDLEHSIQDFQQTSSLPLFIGMDAEWGVQMRLFGEKRFPYAYTVGAANDTTVSYQLAASMAQDCRELGIHMNFSPVADVNANPKNPVIGFRSFGENSTLVAQQMTAFVKGFQDFGVMACLKHFPGHGNTDKDSHHELPTVSSSLSELENKDFIPFKAGIKADAASVMIGHLNVPAIDDSGLPTSLSPKIIKKILKEQMNFKGLVISDALNMKAVANKYGKTDVVVKAFQAGCDILLFPESVSEAINAIEDKVKKGEISENEINERCLKVLEYKNQYVRNSKKFESISKEKQMFYKSHTYEKALTVLKNESELLPFNKFDSKTALVSVGTNTYQFKNDLNKIHYVKQFHYFTAGEAKTYFPEKSENYHKIIIAVHANTVRSVNQFGIGSQWNDFLNTIPKEKEVVLILFGNPLALQSIDLKNIDALIVAYENNELAQSKAAELLTGAYEASGKLPLSINEHFHAGFGLTTKWSGRLKSSSPFEFGISEKKMKEIDQIIDNGIQKGAFPGCQIAITYKGALIYQKSYGTIASNDTNRVKNDDLYDIASVTKIAATTSAMMHLQSNGLLNLDKKLADYLDNISSSSFQQIKIRAMMAHQAGLPAWIPFYKRTLVQGNLNEDLYHKSFSNEYNVHVADQLWMKKSYVDSIYQQIVSSKLGKQEYLYSDLGYYYMKRIIEKIGAKSLDAYLYENLYSPMGMRRTTYMPLNKFEKNQIAPTELDNTFRKQLIHGYVHDPGAAMLGGVAGHAGLFSTATDLSKLLQMYLNGGWYGGKQIIKKEVLEEYTKAQFEGNRRGVGFDRPKASGGGTCHELASQKSYGHSGFTGTLVWADPVDELGYVFLSNRVNPDADNWKIRDMNIRTEIQRVIYEAIHERKLK